jgi:hypothetical protein
MTILFLLSRFSSVQCVLAQCETPGILLFRSGSGLLHRRVFKCDFLIYSFSVEGHCCTCEKPIQIQSFFYPFSQGLVIQPETLSHYKVPFSPLLRNSWKSPQCTGLRSRLLTTFRPMRYNKETHDCLNTL